MVWSRYTLPPLSLMLPLLVTILSYLICDIEFRNDNIRALFSLPAKRRKLYLSKILILSFLLLLLCFVVLVGFVLGGYLLGICIPSYGLMEYAVWKPSMQMALRVFVASLCVGIIEFVISMIARDFTLPVLSSLLFSVIAIFASNESFSTYFPFTTYTYLVSSHPIEELLLWGTRDLFNIFIGGGALLLGLFFFSPERKRILSHTSLYHRKNKGIKTAIS